MEKTLISVLLLLVALSCTLAKNEKKDTKEVKETRPKLPQTLSRGWGINLSGLRLTKKLSIKPGPTLKKVFAGDKELQNLAEKFVLLNLVYETTDNHLSPDGQYVPRILFVDPSLTVRADITGRYSNRLYAYEPSDAALLKSNMNKALTLLKTEL